MFFSPPPSLFPASHWVVLPSEGTEWHSVILLTTLFAPCPRGRKLMKSTLAHFVPLRQGQRARSAEGVDKIANLLTAHRSVLSTLLFCRGAGGESFSLPYILYNKVYSPSFRLLLSVLHSFFLFFLKNLSYSFAGLRKSHTFALAKRERLLLYGGVGFLAQMKKEFFERFS